jgi:SAM-dependent methyltransferase
MSELRDYRRWHQAYDDAGSGLSWRLRAVQRYLRDELDARAGPVEIVSVCAGDGRDVIGVLAGRADAMRVRVTLIELDPIIASAAHSAAVAAGLGQVDVRVADAGDTSAYVALVPADVVLLVGIFGNISDEDLKRTIDAAPQLCRPGGALIWSRGRDLNDRNDSVRACFADAGFTEVDYLVRDAVGGPALGLVRYDGPVVALDPNRRLFTFQR